MPKRGTHGTYLQYCLLFIFLCGVFIFVIFFGPSRGSTIGFFVSQAEQSADKTWNFQNLTEYIYNSATINVSNAQVQLTATTTSQTTTTTQTSESALTAATEYETGKEPKDRLSKVLAVDGEEVQLKDDKSVLEIVLDTGLATNDILSLYIKSGSEASGQLFICTDNTGCASGQHGQVIVPSNPNAAWYNITLTSISSTKTTFGLDSPDKIKIDAVKGYKKTTTSTTTSTTTYPSSAMIETLDLQPTNWKKWGTFTKTETLNNQQVQYHYSTDSGSSWIAMPSNGDVSAVAGTKIRTRATLQSSGSATPIITLMKLAYTTEALCSESWNCGNWTPSICPANATQSRSCTDGSNCGTAISKPSLSQSCTYTAPPALCTENWNCTSWTPPICPVNSTQARTCTDISNCNTSISKPALAQNCIYTPSCQENWITNYAPCLINDLKLKYYLDNSSCGTKVNLPLDNGTSTSCDYCTPNWQATNISCDAGNNFLQSFSDANNCYNLTRMEAEFLSMPKNITFECNYCATHNCTGSFEGMLNSTAKLNATTWRIDAKNSASTTLEVTGNFSGDVSVSVVEYYRNTKNVPPPAVDIGKYFEIEPSKAIDLSTVKMTFSYTDQEIQAAGLDENTLAMYYFNDASATWTKIESFVDKTANTVTIVVPHWSTYGLFGESSSSSGSGSGGGSSSGGGGGSSSGGGGGGGSGSSNNGRSSTTSTTAAVTTAEIPLPAVRQRESVLSTKTTEATAAGEIPQTNLDCNYVVEVSLPEQILTLQQESFEGELVNKGNCLIQKINFYASPELQNVATFSPATIENLPAGEKSTFLVIRKSKSPEKKWLSVLTGSAVMNWLKPEAITGAVIVEVVGDQELSYTKNLAVTLEIPAIQKVEQTIEYVVGGLMILSITVIVIFLTQRKSRTWKARRAPAREMYHR